MPGFPKWFLVPLRLFLAVTFIYAGLQKLTDPQYFNPAKPGYIGKQIIGFATGSPIHDLLIRVAVPHAMFFGALVAYGELAIGLGALIGLLLRPAAFFGMFLSLLFFLSASWHVRPYFYGADIVFVFGWLTLLLAGPVASGMPSLDALLAPRLVRTAGSDLRPMLVWASSVILGVGEEVPALVADQQAYGRMPQSQQQYHARRTPRQKSRRDFLWGVVAGGVMTVSLGVFTLAFRGGDDGRSGGTTTSNGEGSQGNSSTPSSNGGGAGTSIAVASQVPTNSAVTFTIPGNGDPGVLVHLNSGQFVAYDATCTHAGCPVDYDTGSQHLLCPCHGAEFDPAHNASVVQGPTDTPLTKVAIHIDSATGAITLA